MPRAEELLTHPGIAEWMQTHQGSATEVQQAAKLLAEKPDGLAALQKILPALSKGIISGFVSYKTKDEMAARVVVETLRTFSAGKLKITYQAEFTKNITGQPYRQAIKTAVCGANWFILLLPDPSDDWDWCLYETGVFDCQPTSADRLICLHHPDTEIPDPIKDYHGVPATLPKVEEFLRMAFLEANPIPGLPPINPGAAREIPRLAAEIVEAIRAPRKELDRHVYEPWISLGVPHAKQLEHMDDLDTATILSANPEALKLFDLAQQPATWGNLRRYIQEAEGDSRWRNEMFHVIRKIAQGRLFHPIQAVFHASDGKMYRPVACAVDREGKSGPIHRYHITFTEEVGTMDSRAMPQELSSLATLLRFVFRFRWEVLETFSKGSLGMGDVERLDNAFRRMKKDWESRGMGQPENIVELFPAQHRQRVGEILMAWQGARNPEGTGELDLAIARKDPTPVPEILRRFMPLSQEFLELAADRFSELIAAGR
ncbi:MAG: hypothetical protein P1P84_18120 [Deferrisomatales bacterium]|nr:hypothetical protein [Deferrisomatales bacterium]